MEKIHVRKRKEKRRRSLGLEAKREEIERRVHVPGWTRGSRGSLRSPSFPSSAFPLPSPLSVAFASLSVEGVQHSKLYVNHCLSFNCHSLLLSQNKK